MNEETTTIVADDAQDDRDLAEFRQAWEEPPDLSAELDARQRFETLIADLSLKFINLPANQIDFEIEDAQRRVCLCHGLDMSSLWQWSNESPGFLALTHLYRPSGGPPIPEPMDAQEYFPWCVEQLLVRQSRCRFVHRGSARRRNPRQGVLASFRHQEYVRNPAFGRGRAAHRRIVFQ